jgi:NAD(P)H-quinone oxidoreductase subunit K
LPTHRYCTVAHQMKAVEPIVDGRYLRAETQKAALAAAEGLPVSAAEGLPVAAANPAINPA